MRLECVEAFADASVAVLEAMLGDEFGRGSPRLVRAEQRRDGVTVRVSFFGEAEGFVALNVDEGTALRLFARATGEEQERLAPLGVDYVLELANVICGAAVGRLHELGFEVAVRPPRLLTEADAGTGDPEPAEACQIPVYSPHGGILVQVVLRTK